MVEHIGGEWPALDVNYQIQILSSTFYLSNCLHYPAKSSTPTQTFPFAVPVRHDEQGGLCLDTILLDPWRIGVLFSFSRAYFLVDMEVPSGYVQFLRGMLP